MASPSGSSRPVNNISVAGFAYIQLDVSDFPAHNYVLALWQRHFERILAGWIDELRVPTLRGEEVVSLAQDGSGVDVELAGGRSLRADYLVGCDGGRSVIRKSAGIDFLDWIRRPASSSPRSRWRVRRRSASAPRVVASVPSIANRTGAIPGRVERGNVDHAGEPTLDDLRELLSSPRTGPTLECRPSWISRFTDMTRQAASYRAGRVLLAGDAAHVHSPHGGQGLNVGVQGAVNLGWKLAQVVGDLTRSLLDTYHAERHPVGARVSTTPWRRSRSRSPTNATGLSTTRWLSCWPWTSHASASPR